MANGANSRHFVSKSRRHVDGSVPPAVAGGSPKRMTPSLTHPLPRVVLTLFSSRAALEEEVG